MTDLSAFQDGQSPADLAAHMRRQAVGFWLRGLARILDTAFLFAVNRVLLAVVDLGFGPSATARPTETVAVVLFWSVSVLGTFAYYAGFERIACTTVGKALVGAQIVDLDLGPIRLRQAIKRSLGFFVDALFFGIVGAIAMTESPLKQRIGDKWAKTRVVRRAALLPPLRTPLRAIVIGGFVAVGMSVASNLIMAYLKRHG